MSGPIPTALHVFATFAVGGPQARFATLANHFGREWRHLIVAMDGERAAGARLQSDIDVSYPAIDIRKGAIWSNVRAFRRALQAWQPDVLVTSNWGSIEWAMANLPRLVRHVHTEDGFGPEEQTRQIPRRALTRRLVLRGSIVVVPSRTLERIATTIWRLPPAVVRYVPNGIDLGRFVMRTAPAGDPPVIGTVAALRPEKNLARLMRAFQQVRARADARLMIVGDGPERAGLEMLAGNLGIAGSVEFIGHTETPEKFYPCFDVFALTSDTEQMPLSLLEAMASGLAVAATDVGDVRAMLAGENGAYVVPCDDAALAGAIGGLLADPERARRIGAANRARAEDAFDQNGMFAAYDALWRGNTPP